MWISLISLSFIFILTESRRYELGPSVDPGVFVITHIRSCRNGAGYCILGYDCQVDNDFEPDDLGGHCRGLGAAFSPVASFVCCKENPATSSGHTKIESEDELQAVILNADNDELEKSTTATTTTTTTTTATTTTTTTATTTTTSTTTTTTVTITTTTTTTTIITTVVEQDLTTEVLEDSTGLTDSTKLIDSTNAMDSIDMTDTTEVIDSESIDTTESSTITLVKHNLTFETDFITKQSKVISTTVPVTADLEITTVSILLGQEDLRDKDEVVEAIHKLQTEKRRLTYEEEGRPICGSLGGQAVIQAFGKAGANILPDLVASWVTGKTGEERRSSEIDGDNGEVTSTVIYCWMVAIIEQSTQKLICTGTLVRNDLVITTGSCLSRLIINGLDKYRAVLGDSNLMIHLPYGVQTKTISRASLHPEFDPLTMENDIGVMQLDSVVELSDTVCLLCLPSSNNEERHRDFRCSLTGYGRAIRNERVTELTDGILRTSTLDILRENECISDGNSSSNKQICLGNSKTDQIEPSCYIALDTGSPLSCRNNEGRFELTGVLSSGTTCSKDQSFFVKVASYLDWIRQHL